MLMNLLIIAPERIPVPPPVGGSVENSIYQMAIHSSSKHNVTIVSKWKPNYPRTSIQGHVTILRVGGSTKQSYLANALKRVKGKRYDRIQIDNRPRFVNQVRRAFPHTPISVFLHSTTFVTAPRTTTKQAAADLSRANLIVGNSRSLRNVLRRSFSSQKHKVKFVHLGVDLQQFRLPSKAQRNHERAKQRLNGRFVVLFAGRIIPLKGIPVLMKATRIVQRSLPSVKLLIAGDTGAASYKRWIRALARRLHIPVTFKGNIPRNRMHRFYWSGDCFVCPSQGHEAFGLVNVEAMASGTPCIGSRIGGIPEIIRHNRNGLLVSNYRSPQALADSILKLAKNKPFAGKLASRGRMDTVRSFSWRATAKKLLSLYSAGSRNTSR
jgi:spore coat protein SA